MALPKLDRFDPSAEAYNSVPIMATDVDQRLEYGKTFHITFVWEMHVVPIEKVASFRCP